MAESSTVAALRNKVAQIQNTIATYEKAMDQAQQELAVVTATLAIFEREGGLPACHSPTTSVAKLFRRHEVYNLCKAALAASPDGLNTRELADHCLRARDFNADSVPLRRAMGFTVINILGKHFRKGEFDKVGTKKGATLWKTRACSNDLAATRKATESVT